MVNGIQAIFHPYSFILISQISFTPRVSKTQYLLNREFILSIEKYFWKK